MNFKDINNTFFDLENKYSLFDKKISGIFFWELLRFDISRKILIKKGLITEASKKVDNKFIYIIKNIGLLFYNSTIGNPIFSKNKAIFIVGHSRRQNINNKFSDIYTDFIKEKLLESNIGYQDFESLTFTRKHKRNFSSASGNILFFDLFEGLSLVFSKKIKLSDTEIELLNGLELEIKKIYDVNIDIKELVISKLSYFRTLTKYFRILLKWKAPSFIIEVVSYSITNQALNSVAKEFKIKLIELQHGVIDRYHLGYSMGNNKKQLLNYFPDYIFSWGKYWNSVCNYPSNCKVLDLGFPFFNYNKANEINIEKKDTKNILVISQGAIGEDLAKKIFDLAEKLNEYKFYYKLHPGEFHKLDSSLSYLKNVKNIEIVKGERTIYELFSICNIQIGVFSTAVYEGLGFGLNSIVYNLPGVEYLDDLISTGVVKKVNTAEECINLINNGEFNNSGFNSSDFFKENSLELILQEIKKLSINS